MPTSEKCGVYVIEQLGTGRYYIGSSRRIYRRWYEHRRALDADRHQSSFLQNAWNKHGPDAFSFWVIEECEPTVLLAREQEYIDAFRPAFNLCPKAGSRQGVKDTPEVRAKKSRAQRERLAVRTHCPKGHPYDDANTFIDRDGARRCRACARLNTQGDRDGWPDERRAANRAYMRAWYARTRDTRTDEQREHQREAVRRYRRRRAGEEAQTA